MSAVAFEDASGAIDRCILRLERGTTNEQREACDELAKHGVDSFSAVPALTQALSIDDSIVRAAAAHALGAIGTDARAAYGKLKAMAAGDPDKDVRVWAKGASDAIWPSIERAGTKFTMRMVSESITDADVNLEFLLGALASDDADVRYAAAERLRPSQFSGNEPQDTSTILSQRLSDRDVAVRQRVSRAITWMDKAEVPIDVLRLSLQDRDRDVRYSAAEIAGRMGPRAAPAVDELIALLDDSYDTSRVHFVVGALGAIGRPASRAIPRLRELGASPEYEKIRGFIGMTVRLLENGKE